MNISGTPLHRDRRPIVPDIHLMTSRVLLYFLFRHWVTWSSSHGHGASCHKIWCKYLYPIRSYLHLSEIQDGGRRHLGFHVRWIWHISLCSQCAAWGLLQIWFNYLLVTEIDALLFPTFTWINFRFRLLARWSSSHVRDASSHKIWCKYLYPIRSYWYLSEIQDGSRRHLGFSN